MKKMIAIFLVCFFTLSGFSSASNGESLTKSQQFTDDQQLKETLIKKANSGSIHAMLELDERFLFHQYIPGLNLYQGWYDTVLESTDAEAIYSYSRMFIRYRDMYFDGMRKYIDLLDRSQQLGSEDALFQLITMYEGVNRVDVFGSGYPGSDEVSSYMNQKIANGDLSLEDLHIKMVEVSSEERLNKLYEYYRTYEGSESLAKRRMREIEKKLKENGSSLILEPAYDAFYNKSIVEKNKSRLIDDLLLSDHKEVILFAASKLRYSDPEKALEFYQRSLDLNLTDRERLVSYSLITYIYKKQKNETSLVYYQEKEVKDIGGYNATADLLELYQKDENTREQYKTNFNELEPYILNEPNAKRAFADYLYKSDLKSAAIEMLEELANQGDEEAIVSLAKKTTSGATSDKWLRYILNSGNPRLTLGVYEGHHYYSTGLLKSIFEQEILNGNILALRDIYSGYYNENEAYAIDTVRRLIEANDAKTIDNFISQYGIYDDVLKKEYGTLIE